ncbi:MAG: glutamine synthetase family protein [Pseudomonadota bacterium]
MTFAEEYETHCAQHGTPERIEVLFADLNGILRGKWVPMDQWEKIGAGKLRLPFSTIAVSIRGHEVPGSGTGIVVGDPDARLVPVPGTILPVPWADRPTAQVLVEMEEDPGVPTNISPRTILSKMLDTYRAHGWHPVTAAELEFYIIQSRDRADAAPCPPPFTPPAQNYDMEAMDRNAPWLDQLLAACEVQGLPTDTVTAEYGPAQFEVNFRHGPALAACDQALLFRRAARCIAAKHGLEATFTAKPYAAEPGNGFHIHASLVDGDGANVFDEPGRPGPLLTKAVAGTLATMEDLQAIFAPHLNSYRRFGPMSFAPTAPEWGFDHRGAAVRMVETAGPAARLEHRIAGADANPYLVMAALLGGMLHGIENDLALPPAIGDGEPPRPLTSHWIGAVDRFEASPHATAIYGDRFRHVFSAIKRQEIEEIATVIPPQEYELYLSRL